MKDKIKKLYWVITDRLPRHYKLDIRVYDTPAEMIKAYADDIDSDFDTTFEWYLNHYSNKDQIIDGDLYVSPKTPNEMMCITTSDYIMVALKSLEDLGNKEILYLFLRELALSYYSKKDSTGTAVLDDKVKKFARRWYNKMKKEGLINGN